MPAAEWRGLGDFVLAYLLVLATPGPNMLLVGGVAALRGMAGALPLCLGLALGAGALNAALLLAVSALPGGAGWDAARLLGAALLLWVAVSVARQRGPSPADGRGLGGTAATFAAGFCTSATNPLTAAFFGSQFLGPLVDRPGAALAPLAAAATSLFFMAGVAVLLARPACRRAALAWHRPIRIAAAVVLAFMAASTAAATLL